MLMRFLPLFAIALLSFSGLANERALEGPRSGGGADAAVLKDDRVVLADPFVQNDGDEKEIIFADDLKDEVERGIRIAAAYAQSALAREEFHKLILNDSLLFYSVKEIPNHSQCSERLHYSELPDGAKVSQVACTIGNKTWIQEDLFKKMNLREQGLLIVHEGLRRKTPALLNPDLTNFTNGLRVAMEFYNKQIHGDFSPMDEDQQKAIKRLVKAAMGVAKDYTGKERALVKRSSAYEITDHGGLVFINENTNLKISDSAIIGIGTRVGGRFATGLGIEDNAVLIMTNVCEAIMCKVGRGAKLRDVIYFEDYTASEELFDRQIYYPTNSRENGVLKYANWEKYPNSYRGVINSVGENVNISDTNVATPWIYRIYGETRGQNPFFLDRHFNLKDRGIRLYSRGYTKIGAGAVIKNSTLTSPLVDILADTKVTNVNVNGSDLWHVEVSDKSEIKNLSIAEVHFARGTVKFNSRVDGSGLSCKLYGSWSLFSDTVEASSREEFQENCKQN